MRLHVRTSRLLAVLAVLGLALLASGCDGLNARRAVGKGNDEFKAGRYEQAIAAFEEAVKLEPSLAIGHHNLGLAYFKLSTGTTDDEKSKEYGDKAAVHLAEYLKSNPKDSVVRNKMTQIWIDSGNYERALGYWSDQLAAEPANQEIMAVLAGINFKAGNWRPSIDWLEKSLAVSQTPENKRSLYVQIGRRCRQIILNRQKYVGEERIEISNACVNLLHQGRVDDPQNTEILAVINQIFGVRALVQGASFAALVDTASGQDHDQLRRVLLSEAKKAKEAAAPTAPVTAPGTAPSTPADPTAGSGTGAGAAISDGSGR